MDVHALRSIEPQHDVEDLEVFDRIVGDASVWCFGEATHGVHEFLALRNRLFRFAVERLGFTAIAVESHHGDAALADDYVLGHGALAHETVQSVFSANAAFGWTARPFRENLELLRWMRSYNARPDTRRPIRFYGLDVGWSSASPPEWDGSAEVSSALDLVSSMDRAMGARLESELEPLLTRFNSERLETMTLADSATLRRGVAAIVAAFETRRPLWIERASDIEFSRALRHAQIACLLATSAERAGPPGSPEDPRGDRDLVLADSVRWVREREGQHGRVFAFASNGHVQRGPCSYVEPGWRDHPSMGRCLDAAMGAEMVVVGSMCGGGTHAGVDGRVVVVPSADASSVAGVVARVGSPLSLVDLTVDGTEGGTLGALERTLPMRSAADRDDPRLIASDSFDALIFVDRVSPVRQVEPDDIPHAAEDRHGVEASEATTDPWATGPGARGWRRQLHGDRCLRSI